VNTFKTTPQVLVSTLILLRLRNDYRFGNELLTIGVPAHSVFFAEWVGSNDAILLLYQ